MHAPIYLHDLESEIAVSVRDVLDLRSSGRQPQKMSPFYGAGRSWVASDGWMKSP